MATTPKKPSREKEETREGDMSLSPHPLCVHDALPSRKQNRENRIKNACLSNSHSNIAASNDKRPLFVQIPATSSASLVSTSLPIQCLRQTNSFFYRGIFADNFLRNRIVIRSEVVLIGSERIRIRSEVVLIRPERIVIGSEVVGIRSEVVRIRSERIVIGSEVVRIRW